MLMQEKMIRRDQHSVCMRMLENFSMYHEQTPPVRRHPVLPGYDYVITP